jgi:hypothetical protein
MSGAVIVLPGETPARAISPAAAFRSACGNALALIVSIEIQIRGDETRCSPEQKTLSARSV